MRPWNPPLTQTILCALLASLEPNKCRSSTSPYLDLSSFTHEAQPSPVRHRVDGPDSGHLTVDTKAILCVVKYYEFLPAFFVVPVRGGRGGPRLGLRLHEGRTLPQRDVGTAGADIVRIRNRARISARP